MSYIRNYTGTEYSNVTESQLSNIFSTNLWNTTVEVHFHDIQNCRIVKDITGEGEEQKTNWLLIWNEGVDRKSSAYISIKFNNANENCAKSCKCYYDGSWTNYNHEAYIVGNTIVFGDQCYISNYGGRCNMPLTNVEYEFIENKDVLWQDFTQTDLKDWADNQGITSDTTLTAEQKASLEAKIGCTINGDINYKAENEPYLSGSLTFVFPNAVKTKAKQNDNTVITGTSFAVTASDVKEINHGDVILNGAYLWENYHNMDTYINKTNTDISNLVITSYQKQYDSTYLTKLAKYGGGNKQLEFLTNAHDANETPSKTTPGYYYFSSSQDYGGGSSDKYEYWATKGNNNVQIIGNDYTSEPRIQILNDTDFMLNDKLYHKKPQEEIFIFHRIGANASTSSGNFSARYQGQLWDAGGGVGSGAFLFSGESFEWRDRNQVGWPIWYPVLEQEQNAQLTLTIDNSKIEFKKATEQDYTTFSDTNIFGWSIIEDTINVTATAPQIPYINYLSNTGRRDYVWQDGQKVYYDIKYGASTSSTSNEEIVFGPWDNKSSTPRYKIDEYYYKYKSLSTTTTVNGTIKVKTIKINDSKKLWETPILKNMYLSWNQYKWSQGHYYSKNLYLDLTIQFDFNIFGCINGGQSIPSQRTNTFSFRGTNGIYDSVEVDGSIRYSWSYYNGSYNVYAVLVYNQN